MLEVIFSSIVASISSYYIIKFIDGRKGNDKDDDPDKEKN